ncbi:MAG: DUF2461 family protein [Bacteroidales bacterium]|nr:DUF2461 family protein [Bacteroidales bacterium]MBP5614426.1 DUF2461 family protein [Bacteroidales bacterium]
MPLNASVFGFLSALERNNNRDWFQSQKPLYDKIKADLDAFVAGWIASVSAFDSSVRRETPRSLVYCLYRDLRFSPDNHSLKRAPACFSFCRIP